MTVLDLINAWVQHLEEELNKKNALIAYYKGLEDGRK